MNNAMEALVAAAILAPSGDNTQPWHFVFDTSRNQVAICLDESRDPSPMNVGQRMSRIAIGAAVENILYAASQADVPVELQSANQPALVVLKFGKSGQLERPNCPALNKRVTNRKPYDARALPTDQLLRLNAHSASVSEVTVHWITDRPAMSLLAAVIGRADAIMFGEPAIRSAFFSNVRFDALPRAEVEYGLSLASLELSRSQCLALRIMKSSPDRLLKGLGAIRVFANQARKLVESASGLCVISARDDMPSTDVLVGRAMQRAWLALTNEGLAAQPMMSLPVLENIQTHGSPTFGKLSLELALSGIFRDFRSFIPELAGGRPAFVLRFGVAAPPSGRTGRMPLEKSMIYCDV